MNGDDLRIIVDERQEIAFGAMTQDAVEWLQREFPSGHWIADDDGTPYYYVPGLRKFNPGMHTDLREFRKSPASRPGNT